MKKIGFICAALVLCLIVLAIGIEGTVRLLVPEHQIFPHPRDLYVNHPVLGYALRPGFSGTAVTREYTTPIAINSRGLRGPEIANKDTTAYRILGLGDSFTFAQQLPVEQTFLSVMQRRLHEMPELKNRRIEVINAGVNGYGTVHEFAWLKEIGPSLQADAVIVQFFDNDIVDNLIARDLGTIAYRVVKDGYLNTQSEAGRTTRLPAFIRNPLHRHCRSYLYLKQMLNVALNRFRGNTDLIFYNPASAAELTRGWEYTEDVYRDLRDWCRERRIPLAAFYVPHPVVFVPDLQRSYAQEAIEALDWELPARNFTAMMQRLEIPYLNGYTLIQGHAEPASLYYLHDGHFTPAGAELAGMALAQLMAAGFSR